MKPENQYWQYIFLHEKQMAIIEAAPFAVDLLISPLSEHRSGRSARPTGSGSREKLPFHGRRLTGSMSWSDLADQDGLIEPSQMQPGLARRGDRLIAIAPKCRPIHARGRHRIFPIVGLSQNRGRF